MRKIPDIQSDIATAMRNGYYAIAEDFTRELRQVITAGIPEDRLIEMCNAEREGRCVVAQPDNEPLTLDELWGMNGEPVYIVELCDAPNNRYEILDRECPVDLDLQDVNLAGGDCYGASDYGKTWLAYRRKKEDA